MVELWRCYLSTLCACNIFISFGAIIHRSHSRGFADHGWLNAKHSFSFANYYDPERMNFGALRVLNDDTIAGGRGFDSHPHNDMEIITIILKGAIRHRDSVGNEGVIYKDDVQVMSAGTGVYHSEYNDLKDDETNLLQIWISPDQLGVKPRYAQRHLTSQDRWNKFDIIVSPIKNPVGKLTIHQNAYISRISLDQNKCITYDLKDESKSNGVYIFVIEGKAQINEDLLQERDAIGVSGKLKIYVEATSSVELLFIEVPMIE